MTIRRTVVALLGVGMTGLVFLYLQTYYAYNYFFEEQFRMFRFSADYASAAFGRAGGPASYAASFLVQFFVHPYVGAAVSALLYALTVGGLRACLLRLSGGRELPLGYLLPGMFFLWAGANVNCHIEAGLSFAVMVWVLAGYVRLDSRFVRWLLALPLSWLFFHLAGPLSLGLSVAICLIELGRSGKGRFWSLLLLPGALLAPLLTFYMDWTDEPLRRLLTTEAYSNPLAPDCFWVRGALVSLLVAVVLAQLFPLCPKGQRPAVRYVSWSLQLAVAVGLFWKVGASANHGQNYIAKQLDYYRWQERWEELLSVEGLRPAQNLLHTCYQNLALARMGKLSEAVLVTPQRGAKGLWVDWNRSEFTSALLSDVSYTMGNVALAQTLAFEGMIASERADNPRLLLRLVKTNLIEGAYPVAEKYIHLLRQTYAYRGQAAYYATFLYNDQRVEADAELGALRRCRSHVDGLTVLEQAPLDLWQVIRSNPSYRPAFDYFGAFCLLARDMGTFGQMLEEFRQAPALHPMPRVFQEAVVILHEGKPEEWPSYGVEESTVKRFTEFRQLVMAARKNPALGHQLQTRFGATYWYYYMMKK